MFHFKPQIILTTLLLIIVLLSRTSTQLVTATQMGEGYWFQGSWGSEGDRLRAPVDVAIGLDRTMFIADYGFNRITAIRPDRSFFSWGSPGTGNGQFNEPHGIAIDNNGYVYVADTYNHRIQKFSSTGEYITQWGELGSQNGQFDHPYGVAADSDGYVYVLDTDNYRIQKFTNSGNFIIQWNGSDSPGGVLGTVLGITTDSYNNVYVVGRSDGRVIKFDSNGSFLAEWYIAGAGNGANSWAFDLAVDAKRNVYVAVWGQHSVQKFDPNGVLLWISGGRGSSIGYFEYPEGIAAAVDSSGSVAIYVADTRNARVQILNDNGSYRSKWGEEFKDGQFSSPGRINVDKNDNIFVSDAFDNRIQKFTNSGSFLQTVSQFSWPHGVAFDSLGNIYVLDRGSNRVRKFSSTFVWISEWGEYGSGDGQFNNASGIAIDSNDYLYVADSGNHRIQKFTSSGTYIAQWGGYGSGNGQFSSLDDVAIDSSNNVYISDTSNDRIQKFSSNGVYLAQWGSQGTAAGQFDSPSGIAVDSFDHIYVADYWNNRIQKFDPAGTFISQLGETGNGPGQFSRPIDLAVDSVGNLYVLEFANSRVQKFSFTSPAPHPISGLVVNGSFEQTTSLNGWNFGGALPTRQIDQGTHGQYALQLAEPVQVQAQGEGQAWIHQTIFVDPSWERPMLSFTYNMFVNDTMDYSDLSVDILDGVGLNHLATVLRDGYQPCTPNTAPSPATNLGWRSASYDLSSFKGQYIRLVFSNRNLWPGSWGIWTYVDDVRVKDAGALPTPPGAERVYLPVIMNKQCDSPAGTTINIGNINYNEFRSLTP